VRILTRPGSNTAMTDHLDLERQIGDVFDRETLRKAMSGCASAFYCIVDTRSWLRDPAPLYRTNVDGSRIAMEVALETGVVDNAVPPRPLLADERVYDPQRRESRKVAIGRPQFTHAIGNA
jgi:nucleoside-diphosphate-sugar epimerase